MNIMLNQRWRQFILMWCYYDPDNDDPYIMARFILADQVTCVNDQ